MDSINTSSVEMEMDLVATHDGRSKIDGDLVALARKLYCGKKRKKTHKLESILFIHNNDNYRHGRRKNKSDEDPHE